MQTTIIDYDSTVDDFVDILKNVLDHFDAKYRIVPNDEEAGIIFYIED